jgi:hypothetical protein
VNPGQEDFDGDGAGDVCDSDIDGDTVLNEDDNCPWDANPGQQDNDSDGLGDICDPDDDNDEVADGEDNCPFTTNTNQEDFDGDEIGDACDDDVDGDGVDNEDDLCPYTDPEAVPDPTLGCSVAQLCPCDGPRGQSAAWRNHGKYVSCAAKTSETFLIGGLISESEKDAMVSLAAQSECGKR